MGIAADSSLGAPRVTVRSRTHTRFYVALSAFMAGIVVVGFWPSHFRPLLRGNIERPAVIQIHGLVFVGWMALLIAQVVLAARGQIQLYRKVGRHGVVYGWLVVAMGLVVGPAAVGRMAFLGSPALSALVWLSPLFVGMVHDELTRGRVHPVYIVTTIGLFIGGMRILFTQSEAWLGIGRPILDAFL